MDFVEAKTVRDFPPPPTTAEVAAKFAGPVFGFVRQPTLGEPVAGTTGYNDELVEINLSYSLYRDPADPENPVNFAANISDTMTWIAKAEADDQPERFRSSLARLRYPQLWEAVLTIRHRPLLQRALAEVLADHVNHIVINSFDHRRLETRDGPPQVDGPVTGLHAQSALLNIDGTDVAGLTINTDPNVVGWAATVGDRDVVVVLDRDVAPLIDLRLEQWHATSGIS